MIAGDVIFLHPSKVKTSADRVHVRHLDLTPKPSSDADPALYRPCFNQKDKGLAIILQQPPVAGTKVFKNDCALQPMGVP